MRGQQVVFPEQGRAELEEFEIPSIGSHQVLIRTEVSLISAGTELTAFLNAYGTLTYPAHPGYSNVGIIEECGPEVTTHQRGERVLTLSYHASHCIVDLAPDRPSGPEYLQVVSAGVSPEDASFAILGSVAMHGLRKAEPCLGQSAAVIGQGLVGQLLAQLLRVNGCWPVIGIDTLPLRLEKARQSGTPVVLNARDGDIEAAVRDATQGTGVDLAFDATRNPDTLPLLMQIAALSGKVIIVGSIPGKAEISLFDPLQTKELTIIGAWQPRSPITGHAYFPWTQSRNRLAFLNLVRDGSLQVNHLITHRVAPQDAARTYEMIRDGTEWLGVLFRWTDAR